MTLPSTGTATDVSETEHIAKSFVPWNRDDDRARYLGLRCCGMDIMETLQLLGKAKSTLSAWRNDPRFKELEDNLPELRKTLGYEYASLETLRNFRLLMEKDRRVVMKSLDETKVLDKGEHEYLLKMRGCYTPQMLQLLEQMAKSDQNKGIHLADIFINMNNSNRSVTATRVTEEIKVETRERTPAPLGRINEVIVDEKSDNEG